MGSSFTATLNVQCLKKHTCVGCKSNFSYLLTRQIKAEGTTEQAALENAEQMAKNSMANDVDFHPCPSCGIVQPEMTADVKSGWFLIGLGVALAIIAVAFFCGLGHGIRIATSAYIGLGGTIVALFFYIRGAMYDPNTNLAGNLATAQASIASKQLLIEEKRSGDLNPDMNVAGFQPANFIGSIFGVLGLLAVACPLLLVVINGWHLNDTTYPAVLGAGDETTYYFDSKITSLKGYWNGSAYAKVQNKEELGIKKTVSFQANTKNSDWGDTISGKSVSNNDNTMWVNVRSSNDVPDLKGRQLDFEFKVVAKFPLEVSGGFVEDMKEFQHLASAVYSSPGSGSTFYKSWLWGQIGAFILMIIGYTCHSLSARSLRNRGNPTEVMTLGEENENPDDGVDPYEADTVQ